MRGNFVSQNLPPLPAFRGAKKERKAEKSPPERFFGGVKKNGLFRGL
jgi:hypothetical protein